MAADLSPSSAGKKSRRSTDKISKSASKCKKNEKEKSFLKKNEPKYDIFVEPKDQKTAKYSGKRVEDEELQSLMQNSLLEPQDGDASEVELDDFFNYDDAFEEHKYHSAPQASTVDSSRQDDVVSRLQQIEDEELNVLSDLKGSLQSDIEKGKVVKNQLLYWNELVDQLLVPVHKSLKLANSFPNGKNFAVLAEQRTSLLKELSASCFSSINSVLKTISGQPISIDPAYDVWSQLEHYNKQLEANALEVFDSWNSKINVSSNVLTKNQFSQQKSKMKVISQGISYQFNSSLRDVDRLIQRTKINRENISVFAEDASSDDSSKASKSEIFDDYDFYAAILKDKMDASGLNQSADPTSILSRVNSLKSSKIKKLVDTKASKGRKIKYEVFDKLVNFMAPVERNLHKRWSDEKCDEFYASLFGKKRLYVAFTSGPALSMLAKVLSAPRSIKTQLHSSFFFSTKSLENSLLTRIKQDAHILVQHERPLVDPSFLNGEEDFVDNRSYNLKLSRLQETIDAQERKIAQLEKIVKRIKVGKNVLQESKPAFKDSIDVTKVPLIVNESEATPKDRSIVYTDGSCICLDDESTLAAFALYFPDKRRRNRIEIFDGPQSIFRAELLAIHKALRLALESNEGDIEVRSDSRHAIESIGLWSKGITFFNPLSPNVLDICALLRDYQNYPGTLFLRYVKAHCFEYGNYYADKLAKKGLSLHTFTKINNK